MRWHIPGGRTSPTDAHVCAAFSKESRMKFARVLKLDGESGVGAWTYDVLTQPL